MDALMLARLQFGVTTVYHFFFVPLTLGLSILVAIMQTMYYRTGEDVYKRMTKFWGKLFIINFVLGVVTGIVQEFQFGMNWADYSRFVGDIFGAPLAIEALMAFFLESTFLGLWIFGWNKLSKGVHLTCIWLVAIGSNISALWILIANSFMQQPVGYQIVDGRATMVDFWALITNPHIFVQFPHVFFAGMTTGAFFVLAISAYRLLRKDETVAQMFRRSFRIAAIFGIIGIVGVIVVGHTQAQHMVETQPMKMAAAEALWETEGPAPMSILTIGNEPELKDVWAIKIPGLLSFLAYNDFTTEVQGIKNIQADYEQIYGPGNYIPPVAVSYWTFRFMVGAGFVMLAVVAFALYLTLRNKIEDYSWFLRILIWAVLLPYIANSSGWLFTEIARQPWIVFGLQLTKDGVSPLVTEAMVWFSLISFTLVYGALMAVDIYLLMKYAKTDTGKDSHQDAGETSLDEEPAGTRGLT
jgi:cytochrome d ubiquinol oxidase subunit I